MENYKSNSHKSKELKANKEKRNVKARFRKQGVGSRMTKALISDDSKNVGSYIFDDVIIPMIKEAITKGVTGAIEMILYGGTSKSSRRSSGGRVSYRQYYDRTPSRFSDDRGYSSIRQIVREVEIESTEDEKAVSIAESIIDDMTETTDSGTIVTVADFYRYVRLPSRYTDNHYGWSDVSGARIIEINPDLCVIKMPKPMPIN